MTNNDVLSIIYATDYSDLGTEQTLYISKKVSSYKHRLKYVCYDTTEYIANSDTSYITSDEIKWTPQNELAQYNTSGTTVLITFYLETYTANGEYVGTIQRNQICNINFKPNVSIEFSDPNGYLEKYGVYVQWKSKIQVIITATGLYGSTIIKNEIYINGAAYTGTIVTTDTIRTSGTIAVSGYVTDSRGNIAHINEEVTVLAYKSPTIAIESLYRCNADGTSNKNGAYAKIIFSSVVTSLENQNTATYILKYKKTTATNYTSITLTDYTNNLSISSGGYILAVEPNSSYNIVLGVQDGVSNIRLTETSAVIQSIFKLFSWLHNGLGWAFGKIAELANTVEFELDAKFNNAVYGTAMGLGYCPPITANTDLNTYTTIASYSVPSMEIAITLGHRPVAGEGKFIVSSSRGTKIPDTGEAYLWQTYITEIWGTWRRRACRDENNVWTFDEWEIISYNDSKVINSYRSSSQPILWENVWYMNASQTATLSNAVMYQKNGIVLVFSRYDNTNYTHLDEDFQSFFVSKQEVTLLNGSGKNFPLASANYVHCGTKRLYISDTEIVGDDVNTANGTNNGITFDNRKWVLRKVIGV